jgi:hypothetical protein
MTVPLTTAGVLVLAIAIGMHQWFASAPTGGLLTVDRVFIPHYTKLTERRPVLERRLAEAGLTNDTEWIVTFDKHDLTDDVVAGGYQHFRYLLEDGDEGDGPYGPWKLPMAYVSSGMKHVEALRRIVANNHSVALILEDDAVLVPNFREKLSGYLEQLAATDPDWGLVCLGAGLSQCKGITECKTRPRGSNVYRKLWKSGTPSYQVSTGNVMRYADAYLVTLAAAKRIYERILPMAFIYDAQVAHLVNELDIRAYWVQPPLVAQGSEGGEFQSTQVAARHADCRRALGVRACVRACVHGQGHGGLLPPPRRSCPPPLPSLVYRPCPNPQLGAGTHARSLDRSLACTHARTRTQTQMNAKHVTRR